MTRPIGVKPEGSKVDRMAAQSAKIEQHETGKPLRIKGLWRILIPPFPGSNPGAPASRSWSPRCDFRLWENLRHSGELGWCAGVPDFEIATRRVVHVLAHGRSCIHIDFDP
jgi:hypothetical protein